MKVCPLPGPHLQVGAILFSVCLRIEPVTGRGFQSYLGAWNPLSELPLRTQSVRVVASYSRPHLTVALYPLPSMTATDATASIALLQKSLVQYLKSYRPGTIRCDLALLLDQTPVVDALS